MYVYITKKLTGTGRVNYMIILHWLHVYNKILD